MALSFDHEFWRGRLVRYAPLLLWVAVIFTASSTAGASTSTSMFFRPLLEWFFPNASPDTIAAYHGFIRKCAHFTEYAALAFLATRAFRLSRQAALRRFWPVLAFGLVALVASADEYNQSFNPMRTSSPWDVALDCLGGATMIAVVAVAARYAGRGR